MPREDGTPTDEELAEEAARLARVNREIREILGGRRQVDRTIIYDDIDDDGDEVVEEEEYLADEDEPALVENTPGDYRAYYPLFDLGIKSLQTEELIYYRCGCIKVRGQRRPATPCDPRNPHSPGAGVKFNNSYANFRGTIELAGVYVESTTYKSWQKEQAVNDVIEYLKENLRKPNKLSTFTKRAVIYYTSNQLDRSEQVVGEALSRYALECKKAKKDANHGESVSA